jgi:tetratricopeptide (TPR) repeat protein
VVEDAAVENTKIMVSDQTPESAPVDGSAAAIEETSPAAPVSEEAATITPDASENQVDVVKAAAAEVSPVEIAAEAIVEAALDQATDSVAETKEPPAVDQPAYEEYLKDSNDPIHIYQTEADDQTLESENTQASQEPVAKINNQGELQIEMDTKNAHVWNGLGNVYFNTGAFDDAVVSYSKAIELDRWFAWPYSNLALTYVQKGRFVEAILLYQRSIELFKSDKDKAVSWNRLGNVYRRINDYENAIASYQRADELDPDNTTLSLQSRFSLLGNYVMEQKATYVS